MMAPLCFIIIFIIIILFALIILRCDILSKVTIDVIHFSKCEIKRCQLKYYVETGLHTYITTIRIGNNECTSSSFDVFKACKKYKDDTVVCDIDLNIMADGTSKIIIKSIGETVFDKEEILNGKYNSEE